MSRWKIYSSLKVDAGLRKFVKTVQAHHVGAEFVDSICVETRKGSGIYTDDPVYIFHQTNPPNGYHPYFAMYWRPEYPGQKDYRLYIASGESFDPEVKALLVPNKKRNGGELIYSRYRHDYFTTNDGKNMIDGGRDYVRHTLPDGYQIVTLNVHTRLFEYDGELYQGEFTKEREALRYYGGMVDAVS